jgi:hypothetical protein
MTLACGFYPLLGSAEGISGIVLLLKPLPFAELILPLNDNLGCHQDD